MHRLFAFLGALSALVSVGAGAFGAHGLRATLPPDQLEIFETAAQYQMYHAFGLIAVSWLWGLTHSRGTIAAGLAFAIGTLLFSGSLYVLSLTGARWLGAVTPLGGVAFLIGWAALAYAALRARPEPTPSLQTGAAPTPAPR